MKVTKEKIDYTKIYRFRNLNAQTYTRKLPNLLTHTLLLWFKLWLVHKYPTEAEACTLAYLAPLLRQI